MKLFSRHEWDYLAIGDGPDCVTRQEADALLRLAESAAPTLGLSDEGERVLVDGRHRLRMQQIVGVLATSQVTLEILPKIDDSTTSCRAGLVEMLAAAGKTRIASLSAATMDCQKHSLLEVVIAAFARDLLAALRPGIQLAYKNEQGDLTALRGRLNPQRQFSHLAGRADNLACSFDELSADTPLNRILKAAGVMLASCTRRPSNRRLLNDAILLLDHASPLPGGPLPDVHFNRMNQRFEAIYKLAALFLNTRFQNTTSGRQSGIAMLFRMNQLFEEWIGTILAGGLRPPWDVHLQASGRSRHALQRGERALFSMFPDILLHQGGNHVILDTKWKRLASIERDAKRKVAQSDVYQLLAYRHYWEANAVGLIYPGTRGECVIDRLHIPGIEVPFLLIEVPVSNPRLDAKRILQCVRTEVDGSLRPSKSA